MKRLLFYFSMVCISLTWLSAPACAQAEVPVWTNGDFWKYEGTVQSAGVWVDVTMRMEVVGSDQISIRGTTYDCYRLDVTLKMSMQGMTLTATAESWSRKSDLADVRSEMKIGGEETTISYSPPLAVEWPLQVGNEWSGSSTVITESTVSGDSEETWDYSAEVESMKSITVPAGTFETYEIHTTVSGLGYTEFNYAPEVGYHIRLRNAQAFGSDDPIDLVDYRFQAVQGSLDASEGIDILWFVLIAVVIIIVVLVLLGLRIRRRSAWPIEKPPAESPPEPPGQW